MLPADLHVKVHCSSSAEPVWSWNTAPFSPKRH